MWGFAFWDTVFKMQFLYFVTHLAICCGNTWGKKSLLFVLGDNTLHFHNNSRGFVPGRNSKDRNQLAKTHISSLGETSPAPTSCSPTNSCSCTGLSSLPPCLLGRLLPLSFTPAVAWQRVEQSKMFHLQQRKNKRRRRKKTGEINVVTDQRSRPRRTVFPLEKSLRTTALFPPISRHPALTLRYQVPLTGQRCLGLLPGQGGARRPQSPFSRAAQRRRLPLPLQMAAAACGRTARLARSPPAGWGACRPPGTLGLSVRVEGPAGGRQASREGRARAGGCRRSPAVVRLRREAADNLPLRRAGRRKRLLAPEGQRTLPAAGRQRPIAKQGRETSYWSCWQGRGSQYFLCLGLYPHR